jgi:hypothetical protein
MRTRTSSATLCAVWLSLFPEAWREARRKRTRRWIEGSIPFGISGLRQSEQPMAECQSVEIGGQVFGPRMLEHTSNLVREDAFHR